MLPRTFFYSLFFTVLRFYLSVLRFFNIRPKKPVVSVLPRFYKAMQKIRLISNDQNQREPQFNRLKCQVRNYVAHISASYDYRGSAKGCSDAKVRHWTVHEFKFGALLGGCYATFLACFLKSKQTSFCYCYNFAWFVKIYS